MIKAAGVRIGWQDLPAEVRIAVQDILGQPVVEAASQPGGFSPGTADRVRTADGGRAFVKAVGVSLNEHSVDLHRREARVTALLPPDTPAPRLLGSYDDGQWIALVLEDVEGRHPRTPWVADELDAVLAMLRDLAARLTPAPVEGLPTAAEVLGQDFGGWQRIAETSPTDLTPWAADRLPELCALAEHARTAVVGDTLVHIDVRADNLLVGPDGRITLVDWPWACTGPAWLDTLLLLINVRLFGGHSTDRLLAEHAKGADPYDLTAVLAGIGGFFLDVARQPPQRGLPTVREFQRAQAATVLAWLRERL
jgi:aminoglycoside phosphotransferase (APT) family kinase protein